jgi:cell wall-associated NlpC family hydrolase
MSGFHTVLGTTDRLWSGVRGLLLPRRRRDADRGAMAARVGGGVTGLAVMAGIAFISTMCGPSGATASGLDSTGGGSSSGVVQASASSSSGRETITISAHGEPGSSQKTVRVDIPENVLRSHQTAAEAYGLPWELVAAVGAIETQNGQYELNPPNWRSGLKYGQRNPYGAAGIVQFGVSDLNGGNILGAGNAWGGKPYQSVAEREPLHYDVGEMPDNPRYFGIDGNDDGKVNVWDQADNITSGAFRLAYYARQAERNGSASVCGSGRSDLTPIECTVYRHNPARWYVAQVLEVAEYYSGSGIAPTSPSLSLQQVSADSGGGQDCPQGTGVDQAAFLGNAGEAHRGVVEFVRNQIGKPYVWGAQGPSSFDCSGLALAAWRSVGVDIPRTTFAQWNGGSPSATWGDAEVGVVQNGTLDVDSLQPGDLLYMHYSGQSPSHMGIYVGGGRMVHAPRPGSTVTEVPIDTQHYQDVFIGAIRIDPGSGGAPETADV